MAVERPPTPRKHTRPMRASQMKQVNDKMKLWSWGAFEFEWRVVGPLKAGFTTDNCGLHPPFDGAHGKDTLGKAAALRDLQINVDAYDYQMYWMPPCSPGGVHSRFAGIAKSVGGTVGLMHGGGAVSRVSGTLAHEFGHLFGAEHAGTVSDINRGSVAWCDSDSDVVDLNDRDVRERSYRCCE